MSRSVIEVMVDNIVSKWERLTGRKPGDAGFVAPETSSTLSIVYALQDLDTRLQKIETLVAALVKSEQHDVGHG